MPFKSEKQRRYLWANHPEIARRWTDKYGSQPKGDAPMKTKDEIRFEVRVQALKGMLERQSVLFDRRTPEGIEREARRIATLETEIKDGYTFHVFDRQVNQVKGRWEKHVADYVVDEPTQFRRGFEVAAWYEMIEVEPGRYPIRSIKTYLSDYPTWAIVDMPGVVVEQHTPSLFGGVAYSEGSKTSEGKPTVHHVQMYLYSVENAIEAGGVGPIQLKEDA